VAVETEWMWKPSSRLVAVETEWICGCGNLVTDRLAELPSVPFALSLILSLSLSNGNR
jgi:hypothetical protein